MRFARSLRAAAAHWWPVALLGLSTIGAYGLVLYAFSALIAPIGADTGWSVGALSGAFSLSMVLGGLGAAWTGRLVDRAGGRAVMLSALGLGAVALMVAARAQSLAVFVLAWGVGGGTVGAGLFYNVTMALTARIHDADRARAFALLTVLGGLAGPIYFPLAGVLAGRLGWRTSIEVLVAVMVATVVPAALLVPGRAAGGHDPEHPAIGLLELARTPGLLRISAAFALGMAAVVTLQVHQVGAMQAAGLSLAGATAVAGGRGALSLPGRALLDPIVARIGVRRAVLVLYGSTAAGAAALLAAGPYAFVVAFAVLTGLTFGTTAPLHGLFSAEAYGTERIGAILGVQQTAISLAAAIAPFGLGLTVDASGGYGMAVGASVLMPLAAAWLLPRRTQTPSARRHVP